jgi:hypothetical protein
MVPARLRRGRRRLEVKVVEFRIPRKKTTLGDTVLPLLLREERGHREITFGTNVLHDDGCQRRPRVARLRVHADRNRLGHRKGEARRLTAWVLDPAGRRSNTVTLAIQYD